MGRCRRNSLNRIIVIQGPIFNDQVDRWAGDVQIPSSFFKVILWKGRQGLRSVGLVVDQLALLDEQRKPLGPPKTVSHVDVSQWRVRIRSIEKRSGLDFGGAVRQADTIQKPGQPHVGEAQVLIKSFDDLLPPHARA